jgi:flagellar basal-body rod protein FlgB
MEWIKQMSDSLFIDSSMKASEAALDGLSLRQQAISRNLANVDTPAYHAQTVDFESTLKNAISGKKGLALQTTNPSHLALTAQKTGYTLSNRPGGSERADQNNVDIDVEMTDQSETGIQYQAVSQAVSKKLALLKLIAR